MPAMNILIDERQFAEVQELLAGVPGGARRVLSRALNKVATSTRAEIVREVSEAYNVRPSAVRGRNTKLGKATPSSLRSEVLVQGGRIPLSYFDPKREPRGVSYSIRKEGRRVLVHAFLVRFSSGHVGLMQRAPDAKRYPILQPKGPSVPVMVEGLDDFSEQAINVRSGDQLEREIDTQIGLALDGQAGYGDQ